MTKKLSDDAAYYLIDAEGLMFRNRYIEPQYRDKSGQKFLWTNIKSITIEEIYVIKSESSPNVVSSRYAFTSQFGLPAEVSFVDGSGFVLPIPVEILSTFVSQCNDFAGREVCRITKLN